MKTITAQDFQKKFGEAGVSAFSQPVKKEDGYLSNVASAVKGNINEAGQSLTASAEGKMNPLAAGANIAKNVSGAILTPVSVALKPIFDKTVTPISDAIVGTAPAQRLIDVLSKHPELVGAVADTLETGLNVAGIEGTISQLRGGMNFVKNNVKGGIPELPGDAILNKASDTIENIGRKISSPEVSEATKVSLNPKEALKGTDQDIQVSIGGKLKNLSEITPTENMKLQLSTEKSLTSFTKQAEMFAKDRSVKGGSPVEMVGNRVDKALDFANRKRQVVGAKMGEIETKYTSDSLPIGEKTLNTFTETLKSIDNPKYGVDTAEAPIVKKLVNDFDNLEKGGATIGERLDFIRSWDKYINDAKDAFGKFKENATVNTRIQNAIRVLKEETVNAISIKDKVYRNLRQQYRVYKQLDEIGDALLGKDGALGQRIKGAATVKRAIQSNSDAGARQFLAKLKEITGYDAIKEGDIALTAMENVGDYQGLSLLNIVKGGKIGLINKGLEKLQDMVVGDKSARTIKYIQKK